MLSAHQRQVFFIYPPSEAIPALDSRPPNQGRLLQLFRLLDSHQLLIDRQTDSIQVQLLPAIKGTRYQHWNLFHTDEYLNALFGKNKEDHQFMLDESDTPLFPMLQDYILWQLGGIQQAMSSLLSLEVMNQPAVAIWWPGGRHHAQADKAAGYCYVNDCVWSILTWKTSRRHSPILYLDLDLHHGDGAENALIHTRNVILLSVHYHAAGFYPGSGAFTRTRSNVMNCPLPAQCTDAIFLETLLPLLNSLLDQYGFEFIVVQCGTDGLLEDPHQIWSLTEQAYLKVMERVLKYVDEKSCKLLVLGGGGYNHSASCIVWTLLTALIQGMKCDENVPEHCLDWPKYVNQDYKMETKRPGSFTGPNAEAMTTLQRQVEDMKLSCQ